MRDLIHSLMYCFFFTAGFIMVFGLLIEIAMYTVSRLIKLYRKLFSERPGGSS